MKKIEKDYSNSPIYKRAVEDTCHRIREDLKDILDIQCLDGNWNYDPYMYGLANGLIMAQSLIDEKEPIFLKTPKIWLKDYPTLWTRIKWRLFGVPQGECK